MNTLNPRKVIALVTAVSLAFLQAVPVGYAGNEPVDQAPGTSVSATVPADNTKTVEDPVITPAPTSSDFMASNKTLSLSSTSSELEIPAEVRDLFADLKEDLGTGFSAYFLSQSTPGNYLIKVVNKLGSSKLTKGQLQGMTITVNDMATVTGIVGVYKETGSVNGMLLYEGMTEVTSDALAFMALGRVMGNDLSAGTMSFEKDGYTYQLSKAGTDPVVVNPVKPSEVSTFTSALQGGLDGRMVTSSWIKGTHPPQYKVTVSGCPEAGCSDLTGAFSSMEFVLDAAGKLNVDELHVSYNSITGEDAKLLYAVMPQGVQDGGLGALISLTGVVIESAVSGVILFKLAEVEYKCNWEGEKAVLENLTEQRETLRQAFLTRVGKDVELTQAEVARLTKELESARVAVEAEIVKFLAELETGKTDLGGLRNYFEELLAKGGLPAELKMEVEAYLADTAAFLADAGSEAGVARYVAMLQVPLRSIQVQIEVETNFLVALDAYEVQVKAAKTLQALQLLEGSYPQKIYPAWLPPPAADPRTKLNEWIAIGNELKDRIPKIPGEVTNYVSDVVTALGDSAFIVGEPELQGDGSYKVTIVNSIETMQKGVLSSLSFVLSAGGVLQEGMSVVSYNGMTGVKGPFLLFAAKEYLNVVPPPAEPALSKDVLALSVLCQLMVVRVDGEAICFTKGEKGWRAYTKDEVVNLEDMTNVLPLIDQLAIALGPDFKMEFTSQPNPVTMITAEYKGTEALGQGALSKLYVRVDATNGDIVWVESLYEGFEGDSQGLLSQMVYDGMSTVYGDVWLKMEKVTVVSFTEDPRSVTFDYEGERYHFYVDELGNLIRDPSLVVLSPIPEITNQGTLTVSYKLYGVEQTQTFTLVEGTNDLTITVPSGAAQSLAGSQMTKMAVMSAPAEATYSFGSVVLDTIPPVISEVTIVVDASNPNLITINYKKDGIAQPPLTMDLLLITDVSSIQIQDAAGNKTAVFGAAKTHDIGTDLDDLLNNDFMIIRNLQADGRTLIDVVFLGGASTSKFYSMSFYQTSEGVMDGGLSAIKYMGVFSRPAASEATMLFEAMKDPTIGIGVSDAEALAHLTEIEVTSTTGTSPSRTVFFTDMRTGLNWKCYRNADQSVQLDWVPPTAVTTYWSHLQTAVEQGFVVSIEPDLDGIPQVMIVPLSPLGSGKLKGIIYNISMGAVVDASTFLFEYQEGITGLDSGILWDGVKQVNGGLDDMTAMAFIAQMELTKIEGGEIYFYKDVLGAFKCHEQGGSVTLDDLPTRITDVVSSIPAITNQLQHTVTYKADGVEKTVTITLDEQVQGLQTPVFTEIDAAGNITTYELEPVTLDTIAPKVSFTTAPTLDFSNGKIPLTNQRLITVNYSDNEGHSGTLHLDLTGELDGDKTFVIPAMTDDHDNITPATTWHFTLDTTAPVVEVTSVVPSLTNVSSLTVNYKVDGGAVETKVFTLLEGDNPNLTIEATDAVGNCSIYKLPTVKLDTVVPVIVLTNAVPALTNNPILTVNYRVDGGAVQTATFNLHEGVNAGLVITATDAAGNQAAYSFSDVTLDTVASSIEVVGTIPSLTRNPSLTVNYKVDGGTVQTKTFTLQEGNNAALTITATDVAGNISTYTLPVVILDTTAPVVEVTSVVPAATNNMSLTVTYTVDGGAAQSQTFVLVEGDNAGLTLTATDAAGNMADHVLPNVVLDRVAPVIANVSAVPSLTKNPSLTVSYTVDGGAVQTKVLTLSEGDNTTLAIVVTDLAGNTSTYQLPTVKLDSIAPAVVVTSVVPAATNNPALTVTYTVDGGAAQTKVFTLQDGNNTALTIPATDLAGNTTNHVLPNVVLDRVAPVIAVTSVVPSLTKNPSLTVSYTVDSGAVQTKVFTLLEGDNSNLTIEVTDAAGNLSTCKLPTVKLDTIAPRITLSEGMDGSITNQNILSVTYTVDGATKTKDFTLSPTNGGVNDLSITEVDVAGNTTTLSFTITYDPSLVWGISRVQAVSPVMDTEIQRALVSASGGSSFRTASDSITLAYLMNGIQRTQTFELLEGVNELSLVEGDLAYPVVVERVISDITAYATALQEQLDVLRIYGYDYKVEVQYNEELNPWGDTFPTALRNSTGKIIIKNLRPEADLSPGEFVSLDIPFEATSTRREYYSAACGYSCQDEDRRVWTANPLLLWTNDRPTSIETRLHHPAYWESLSEEVPVALVNFKGVEPSSIDVSAMVQGIRMLLASQGDSVTSADVIEHMVSNVMVAGGDVHGGILFSDFEGLWKIAKTESGALSVNSVETYLTAAEVRSELEMVVGAGFTVTATSASLLAIDVSVVRSENPGSGVLQSLSFKMDVQGSLIKDSFQYVFDGLANADFEILFEALGSLLDDPSDIGAIVQCTRVSGVSALADGKIIFTIDGGTYKCYRAADGTVVVEQPTLTTVQSTIYNHLLAKLGTAYNVSVSRFTANEGVIFSVVAKSAVEYGHFSSGEFQYSSTGVLLEILNIRYQCEAVLVDGNALWTALKSYQVIAHKDIPVRFAEVVVESVNGPENTAWMNFRGNRFQNPAWDAIAPVVTFDLANMSPANAILDGNGNQIGWSVVSGYYCDAIVDGVKRQIPVTYPNGASMLGVARVVDGAGNVTEVLNVPPVYVAWAPSKVRSIMYEAALAGLKVTYNYMSQVVSIAKPGDTSTLPDGEFRKVEISTKEMVTGQLSGIDAAFPVTISDGFSSAVTTQLIAAGYFDASGKPTQKFLDLTRWEDMTPIIRRYIEGNVWRRVDVTQAVYEHLIKNPMQFTFDFGPSSSSWISDAYRAECRAHGVSYHDSGTIFNFIQGRVVSSSERFMLIHETNHVFQFTRDIQFSTIRDTDSALYASIDVITRTLVGNGLAVLDTRLTGGWAEYLTILKFNSSVGWEDIESALRGVLSSELLDRAKTFFKTYLMHVAVPEIKFEQDFPWMVTDPILNIQYTLDGVAKTETLRLNEGDNSNLVIAATPHLIVTVPNIILRSDLTPQIVNTMEALECNGSQYACIARNLGNDQYQVQRLYNFGSFSETEVVATGLDWAMVSSKLVELGFGVIESGSLFHITLPTVAAGNKALQMADIFGADYAKITTLLTAARSGHADPALGKFLSMDFSMTGNGAIDFSTLKTTVYAASGTLPANSGYAGSARMIQKYQVEDAGLDWDIVSQKFVEAGWGSVIPGSEVMAVSIAGSLSLELQQAIKDKFGSQYGIIISLIPGQPFVASGTGYIYNEQHAPALVSQVDGAMIIEGIKKEYPSWGDMKALVSLTKGNVVLVKNSKEVMIQLFNEGRIISRAQVEAANIGGWDRFVYQLGKAGSIRVLSLDEVYLIADTSTSDFIGDGYGTTLPELVIAFCRTFTPLTDDGKMTIFRDDQGATQAVTASALNGSADFRILRGLPLAVALASNEYCSANTDVCSFALQGDGGYLLRHENYITSIQANWGNRYSGYLVRSSSFEIRVNRDGFFDPTSMVLDGFTAEDMELIRYVVAGQNPTTSPSGIASIMGTTLQGRISVNSDGSVTIKKYIGLPTGRNDGVNVDYVARKDPNTGTISVAVGGLGSTLLCVTSAWAVYGTSIKVPDGAVVEWVSPDWRAAVPSTSIRISYPNAPAGTLSSFEVSYPLNLPYLAGSLSGISKVTFAGFTAAQNEILTKYFGGSLSFESQLDFQGNSINTLIPKWTVTSVSSTQIKLQCYSYSATGAAQEIIKYIWKWTLAKGWYQYSVTSVPL